MEKYLPLFGEPSDTPPRNTFHFPVKNNREQLPSLLFDIDDFEQNPDVTYVGQFNLYRDWQDLIVVFVFNNKVVFHKRTQSYDRQTYFPLNALPWLIDVLSVHDSVNVYQLKKIFSLHELTVMRVQGARPGEQGFVITDHNEIDPALQQIMPAVHDSRVTIQQYLSDYSLQQAGGLAVLKSIVAKQA